MIYHLIQPIVTNKSIAREIYKHISGEESLKSYIKLKKKNIEKTIKIR